MNYTEITQLALSIGDREDSDLPLRLDGFLFLVEAEINRILKSLEQETFAIIPYTADNVYEYDLPTDFSELRLISKIIGVDKNSKVPYEYCTPEQIAWAKVNKCDTKFYTLTENKIHIYPALSSSEAILLTYVRKIIPLTSLNTTNWLSIKHPDLYIFGLLIYISKFAKDWDAVDRFTNDFNKVIDQIFTKDLEAKYSGVSLVSRIG